MLQFFSSSFSLPFCIHRLHKIIFKAIFRRIESYRFARFQVRQSSTQEAVTHRATVPGIRRKPAAGSRPGRCNSDLQQADGEECSLGEGQGDRSVQRLLLCRIRDDSGARGGC